MSLIALVFDLISTCHIIRKLVVLRSGTHGWQYCWVLLAILKWTSVLKGWLQLHWLISSAAECPLLEVSIFKLLLISCNGVDLIAGLDTIWMITKQVPELAEFASVIAFVERSHIKWAYIRINIIISLWSMDEALFSCFNRIGVVLCSILDLREKGPWVWWRRVSFAIPTFLILNFSLLWSLGRHLGLPLVDEPQLALWHELFIVRIRWFPLLVYAALELWCFHHGYHFLLNL